MYAYNNLSNLNLSNQNKVNLVISEAGPTQFYANALDDNIRGLTGITDSTSSDAIQTLLDNASPTHWAAENANSTLPYTILAYGCSSTCPDGSDGDGVVPCSQAEDLRCILEQKGASVQLFTFTNSTHNDFGKVIHPEILNCETIETLAQKVISCNDCSDDCLNCSSIRVNFISNYTQLFNSIKSYLQSYYTEIITRLNILNITT